MEIQKSPLLQTENKFQPWVRPTEKPYIRIEGITKKFGDFVAVRNVSLNIYRGELFALLGGSGCGKTTLLRMLAGFEKPTEGRIFIDDVNMAEIPPYERPTNMMFQSYALFPHMTVEDNVAFGLKQDKVPPKQIRERVAEMLSLVKMTPLAKRKPHQLSGGQRQRVALARSLAKLPKLLLLDEPLGALDKKLREATQFEIMNIQDRLGITFIVVTHDQEEAMTLATRIGVMDQGQIVQTGTPAEIYEFPHNKFVADFIGSANMFEGRIVEDEPDHVTIAAPDMAKKIYIDHGISSAPGAQVWTAIRPEKIRLTKLPGNGSPPEYNYAEGVVKGVAYMGNLSIYLVKLDSGKEIRVTMTNETRAAESPIQWEDRVAVTWRSNSAVPLLS
ncbi:MAG TPA: polyamine ABC transporter ATP-binding protein [Dongiaceae bacterium]|nr:polyamine ABC transporter ATP-binding protein [Dongiaceae bacterium]